ncbi:MAG: family 78 glycoside hydrolase catalytic domain [Sedimentisphaerales bacterium]|nr:family 78 glycoside hydrolase catalytic domain [Sedimentisphaerales bacterium]
MRTNRIPLRMRPASLVALVLLVWAPSAVGGADRKAPSGLICELMTRPEMATLGDRRPEFGWIVNSSMRDDVQSAYQILVASDRKTLGENVGDLWDTGRTVSARSANIEYSGDPLSPNETYFWKVRIWNRHGQASLYCEPQVFRTGELARSYETTRYPLVTTKVAPTKLVRTGKDHYFVDFGRAAFGTVELTLTSPAAGREVQVHLGEVPDGDNRIDRNPGGSRRYRMMTLRLKEGTHTYRVAITPDKRNTGSRAIKMPTYTGEVMPFRYCEIANAPSALDASKICQIAVHYPFDEDASRFHSSSLVLNDVWELCKYSIKATSFCGVYVDGDRERIPYEADAYINQLCHYCVDREYTMARHTHEYLMTHPTWPTEWILHSVLMASADYMYTGNIESAAHFYEDLKAKTLLSLARDDGLISTQTGLVTDEVLRSIHFKGKLRDIVDWPHGNILGLKGGYGETDDFEFKPINTVVNAFHYRALVLMSRIAKDLGKTQDAAGFTEAAARVKRSFNEKLLDKDKGIYVDGEGSTHSALHANMFPLAFGLVPPDYVGSVAAFVKSRGMVCSVYGSQYLLEALYAGGEDDYALRLMTDRDSDRSWPHMIYDVGTTITLEAWDNKYKPNQDWNHAWGAAPANIIPRRLMGIQPVEPGFAKVRIKPQVGSLTRGSLDLPTVRGTIHADFRSEKGLSFALNVRLPANVEAVVFLPRLGGDSPDVMMDGKRTAGTIEGKSVVLDNVGSGDHRFERTR